MSNLIYRHEPWLFRTHATLSIILWIALIVGTVGIALLYVLLFFIAYLFAQSAFISHIKGTGARVSTEQFPDLDEKVRAAASKIGLAEVPAVYLLNSDGILNAFATKFLGSRYMVLYSGIVDALKDRPDALDFYIGHELGHIKQKHLDWAPVLVLSMWLPHFGAAYRRAQESTCDLHGLACVKDPRDAEVGLAVLATGGGRSATLAPEAYEAQVGETGGFWMSFHEYLADYPWLTKRMARVRAASRNGVPRVPGRNPFAFLLACFLPRVGAGGAGGLIVVVAIIGILAAVAIPAYQDYTARAQAQGAVAAIRPVAEAVGEYAMAHELNTPGSLAEVGYDASNPPAGVMGVELADDGVITVTLAGVPAISGKTFVFSPQVQEGQVTWLCQPETVEPKYLPAACR